MWKSIKYQTNKRELKHKAIKSLLPNNIWRYVIHCKWMPRASWHGSLTTNGDAHHNQVWWAYGPNKTKTNESSRGSDATAQKVKGKGRLRDAWTLAGMTTGTRNTKSTYHFHDLRTTGCNSGILRKTEWTITSWKNQDTSEKPTWTVTRWTI